MSKTDKQPAVSRGDKAKALGQKYVVPVVDRVLQGLAAAFVLVTSFRFVQGWLEDNRLNHDFSLAGAIMVMSVALYLIVRKR